MARQRRDGAHKDRLTGMLARCARPTIDNSVKAGAVAYDRGRHLPALIRMEPRPRGAETVGELEAIVARLARALRAERNRARSGHWTYDLNRHIALRQAHLAESERLAARRSRQRPPPLQPPP